MAQSWPGNKDCPFQRQLDIALTYSQEITSSVLPSAHINITERCFFDNQTTLPFPLGLPSSYLQENYLPGFL